MADRPGRSRLGRRLLAGTLLIATLVVAGTAFRIWQVARTDDRTHADMIVVMGAAQYNGDPSSVLAARLDHAAALWRSDVAPRIVTVGGGQDGEDTTEAQAGADYLTSYGIPDDAVIPVARGSDTLTSVSAVAELASEHDWSTAVIVSDPWHCFRARTMARDEGLRAWTSPTRSGPVVQTRLTEMQYIFRETLATLYYQLTHDSAEQFGTDLG